jgi:hypothetical protein
MSAEEMIDRYHIDDWPIRELLVDYLREFQSARMTTQCSGCPMFWASCSGDLELRQRASLSLRLPAEVAANGSCGCSDDQAVRSSSVMPVQWALCSPGTRVRWVIGGFWRSSQHVPSRAESLVRVERRGVGSAAGRCQGRHAPRVKGAARPCGSGLRPPLDPRGPLRPWQDETAGRAVGPARLTRPPPHARLGGRGCGLWSEPRAYAASRWPISSMGLR